jgi:hypothetical protein
LNFERENSPKTSKRSGPFQHVLSEGGGESDLIRGEPIFTWRFLMYSGRMFQNAALLAGACFFSACAFGASGEIAGFGGGALFTGGGGTHPAAGGSVSYLVGQGLRVFGEFSYAPGAGASVSGTSSGVSFQATASEKLYNYGGGVDYSFGRSERVVPYMLVALGAGRLSASGSGTASSGANTANVNLSTAVNGFNYGVGGGVRIYAGKHWGIKPEFRYQRFTASAGSQNEMYFTGGVFYQFGK